MTTKVLWTTSTFGDKDRSPIDKLLAAGFEVVPNPHRRKLTKVELLELLPGIKGLIAGLETLDREVLSKSELKVISRCGSGLSNVDLKAAKELKINVKNTPLGPTQAVAELTLGAILSLLREIPRQNSSLHAGKWEKIVGRELRGKQVAVIGMGNIGKRVAALFKAFGAEVVAVDPNYKNEVEGIPLLTLGAALKQADIVTLHCSGEKGLLGEKELALMKKGSYLLNAARGRLVDEAALIRAIEEGRILGAWLDVFEPEPYQGSLTKYPQVLLTPHTGSYTQECRRNMEMEAVDNLIGAFNGG